MNMVRKVKKGITHLPTNLTVDAKVMISGCIQIDEAGKGPLGLGKTSRIRGVQKNAGL